MTIEQLIYHTAFVVKQALAVQYLLVLILLAFIAVVSVMIWCRLDDVIKRRKRERQD